MRGLCWCQGFSCSHGVKMLRVFWMQAEWRAINRTLCLFRLAAELKCLVVTYTCVCTDISLAVRCSILLVSCTVQCHYKLQCIATGHFMLSVIFVEAEQSFFTLLFGGTVAAAPPPFRPSKPALCGSCPLVTPYYCRLGDLLCFVFIVRLLCFLLLMYYMCPFSTLILLVGSFDL